MFPIPKPSYPVNTCIVPTCGKPLGQDSKDLGYCVCHEHRLCPLCDQIISPTECKAAWDKAQENIDEKGNPDSLDLRHVRCSVVSARTLSDDPTLSIKQSHYDQLNILRLMVDPDVNLAISTNENNAMIQSAKFIHEMTFDQRYAHLKMLEACIATVSLSISQDKKKLKERADEREKKAFSRAKLEAVTSSRPVGAQADSPNEVSIGEFMKNFSITSRKVAIKLQRDRDRVVTHLAKLGTPVTLAKQLADADLAKNLKEGKINLSD